MSYAKTATGNFVSALSLPSSALASGVIGVVDRWWWAQKDPSPVSSGYPGDRAGMVDRKLYTVSCSVYNLKVWHINRGSGSNITASMLDIHRKLGESTAMIQYIMAKGSR